MGGSTKEATDKVAARRSQLMGWGLVVALGVLAYVLGEVIGPVNAVVVALLLGLLVGNLAPVSSHADKASIFMVKRVLKFAIILLGAGIDASQLALVNAVTVGIIVAVIVLALVVARLLGPRLGLSGNTSILIGVGTAICGASAIAATAPLLKAKQQEIGLALGTIFVFNALAMLSFPVLAHVAELDPAVFGTWAGVAVHDTASAVATGFAYTAESGESATVVKLTRTLFLIPIVLVLALRAAVRAKGDSNDATSSPFLTALRTFPLFVLGFVALAAANTLGWLGPVGSWLSETGKLLIIAVVVAIGLTLKFAKVRSLGFGLAVTGLVAAVVVALVSFGALSAM